tara:strand:+ start:2730 stop:3260 length:531 start_codon:yes stop_codon:yes gene_type:complete
MKKFYFLLFLLSFTSLAAETNTQHFFNENLVIELSTEFRALSESDLNKRYGEQKNPPAYAFSDKDQSVSFTFTQYSTPADKKSMNKIHKSLSGMLRKANDKARWKKDKVYSRLGTKVAVFEYEIKSIGKYQYNLTYTLPVDGKLTLISFTTTDKKYKNKWLDLARESMDSIQLKAL